MLDPLSLRVSFVVLALTFLALFYGVTYRTTRSAYSAWWCSALGLFLVGSGLYLMDGTEQQRWANPLGNGAIVAGAGSVWAGARSIRGASAPLAAVGASVVLTLVASFVDEPATNVWAGAPVFLAAMAVLIGLSSGELWRTDPSTSRFARRGRTYAPILRSMAVVSGLLSVFYVLRAIAFLLVGADGRIFNVWFGTSVTTLITTVVLATVSFSMAALSHADETVDLRAKATHDGLTGLLGRSEALRQIAARWSRHGRGEDLGVLVIADLDDFKRINDEHGHAAGDFALQTFAAACRGAVGPGDVVARHGGDEFLLFLRASLPQALEIVSDVAARMRVGTAPDGLVLPTVSFGLSAPRLGDDLQTTLGAADAALYEAKSRGRDRAVVAGQDVTDDAGR